MGDCTVETGANTLKHWLPFCPAALHELCGTTGKVPNSYPASAELSQFLVSDLHSLCPNSTGTANHNCSLNAKSECLEWFSSDANVSLLKKKKPLGRKVQALFWKLRIVEILPNRKSILKADSTLCIPLRDYALCLPSGPCHSSCHYLDIVSCYRALYWAWIVVWQRNIFLPMSKYYRWMLGKKRFVYLFHYGSVGLENVSIFK